MLSLNGAKGDFDPVFDNVQGLHLKKSTYFMKKALLLLVLTLTMSTQLNAQDAVVHKYALGGRLAGGTYYGPELSFQLGVSNRNRFEFDLGARIHPQLDWTRIAFTTCFHWDFNILNGWNWFIGPGAQVGVYMEPEYAYFPVGVGGQVGMEFDFNVPFDVPLIVAIDTRPMFDLFYPIGYPFYYDGHVAASLRYTFKN
jgi:hypothetical protein